jgi:hypothetical protein
VQPINGQHAGPQGATMANVNLDALITREDFLVRTGQEGGSAPPTAVTISDLEAGRYFFQALRKPDFQRETTEWNPARVAQLIRTFVEDDLIPGSILWKSGGLNFVIDGSHRLSALIAWVQDDYGDGVHSRRLFGDSISDEQKRVAKETRRLVEKSVGSYKIHQEAASNPDSFGPEVAARARALSSIGIQLQWVRGGAAKAEESFIRINQQSATITPQELELIRNRKLPNTIAARAVLRRAAGHPYWASFPEPAHDKIKPMAEEIHDLLFEPQATLNGKSPELPAGGSVYAGTALRMVYDFINLCVEPRSTEPDLDGERTIEYLTRCRRVMRQLLSNHPSSLGLHPAVYFYSWTGRQQAMQFLSITKLIIDWDRAGKLGEFIRLRSGFEKFLTGNRQLLQQVVRKFGSKSSGGANLRAYYDGVLDLLSADKPVEELPELLRTQGGLTYLQPGEEVYEGKHGKPFSSRVKTGIALRERVNAATKCPICGGLVPYQAMSIDHKKRREEGGTSGADNAQITHPFCNTGIKEAARAKQEV